MDIDKKIRTQFPIILAEVYQNAELADHAQIKVQRWVDLFEETIRYLSIAGLALYRFYNISNDQVIEKSKTLKRPSLGHWADLFKTLDATLSKEKKIDLTSPLNQKHQDNQIEDCVVELRYVLDNKPPETIRLQHMLDVMVEFRNKKIGHGTLSDNQAQRAVKVIKPALLFWLDNITFFEDWYLLYIHQVEWEDPVYILKGTKNRGTSLYNAHIEQQQKVTSQRVYLANDKDDQPPVLVSMYPYLDFNNNDKVFYIYSELSPDNIPLLKSTYKSSHTPYSIKIEEKGSIIQKRTIETENAKTTENATEEETKPVSHEPLIKEIAMKPWYEFITPHEDIREGKLDEAIFHADLGDVANQKAPDDYNDAYLFFKKTYLTHGLDNLLHRVHTTLTEGEGSSVVQVQTPFGGGKTHALVAIYHYLKSSDQIKELLPASIPPLAAPVVTIAGNHWNPVEGVSSDGITRRTFWGELAYQLGGKQGYEEFRENDEARISPGKSKLQEFLRKHQPFVLLFDEILEYINRALDEKAYHTREKTKVSLGTQTFSFFFELSEAVATVPKGMLVVTLPSSHLEDFSDETEESLARLDKIFGRLESIETPVKDEEVYEVIRRRLFEIETLEQGEMRAVVHQYFNAYKNNRDDLPASIRDIEFRNKMELAYPFHPTVIDMLYEKWSTFTTFQRTRGVLRLLANVVEDLYQREKHIDLILPGDINLNKPSIRREFLKHIGQEYEGVIGSDIAGHEAKAQNLDKNNREWDHLAERISTAIFYHSFSAGDSEKGVRLPRIKLSTMRSDTIPALVTDILQRLTNTLWYLNTRGDSYYFSDIPNLNRMIMDKKDLFNESYRSELFTIIEDELGDRFRSYLWPENGDGIPDNRDLKLVVLKPEDSGDLIPEWLERKGETFREYKNTLFFALADTSAFASLREDVKKALALEEIEKEINSGESQLPEDKRSEVQHQLHNIKRDYSYNVRRMYHLLHLGDREIDLGNPTTGAESLSNWYWRELTSDDVGAILTNLHYRFIVKKFLSENDQIDTSVLINQFYKDPSLPVPAESGVVARAIQLGIQDGAFGLIEEIEDEVQKDTLKYKTEYPLDGITFDPGSILITKERSEEIWREIQADIEEGIGVEPISPEVEEEGPEEEGAETEKEGEQEELYKHLKLVVSGIPASKIADINRGVLLPISRTIGDFSFKIDLEIDSEEGLPKSVLEDQIKETIRQIGGKVEEEEKD